MAVFLLAYPVVTLTVQGGASGLFLAISLISLVMLITYAVRREAQRTEPDQLARAMSISLCLPLLAVLASELWHGKLLFGALDSPSRFIAAIPIFLFLRTLPISVLRWSDLSFASGAYASLAICLFAARDWGEGRLGSSFLNPIHFGNIALLLGILSVLSLHWWCKDGLAVRILKIGGLFAGLSASLLTGSRGGWVAIPLVVFILLYARGGSKPRWWRVVLLVAVALALAAAYFSLDSVRGRILKISSDIAQYAAGHKDTSIGIRFQIYEAALASIPAHPIFGLGAGGFGESLGARVAAGLMTSEAAQLGRGEVHNQLLAFLVNYGMVGALSLLSIYLVPGLFFWRALHATAPQARKGALMGLVLVTSFFVFGLTVEMFDLKMTASFYAAMIALLAGIVARSIASTPAATIDKP